MKKAIILNANPGTFARVFAQPQMDRLRSLTELDETVYTCADQLRGADVKDAEVVFSTWGMLPLSGEEIRELLPSLKAVFYAAGSVQHFARPFLDCGAKVFSAWHANGVAVAQYTFSQILLAAKGFFRIEQVMRSEGRSAAYALHQNYPGGYGVRVGLLGCGSIGSRVARMLKDTDCEVWAYDPFLPQERARELGVKLTDMDDIFANCLIVSNHLANLPTTQRIIKRSHFMSMPAYATFINTGRGAPLCEDDLYAALVADPTRTALLDVRDNEGKSDDHPLNSLPNCLNTPHIAGASGLEVRRMADYMMNAFCAWEKGEGTDCEVSMKMLETMA